MLHEIYGYSDGDADTATLNENDTNAAAVLSSAEDNEDDESKGECVVCLASPRDTLALPCRHLCLCLDCARTLRTQSNRCPMCRQREFLRHHRLSLLHTLCFLFFFVWLTSYHRTLSNS
jgi:hypothetical protein